MGDVSCVKYIGTADVRYISEEDWSAMGVFRQPSVRWSAFNGFTVLGTHLQSDAVKYLREDDGFVVLMKDQKDG
jgi:hypothetical protein